LIKAAQEYCEAQGLRLTPPRVLVLDIIARSKKPLGAYDILDALSKNLDNPKPPTAYRAIEFWQAHGFIHRIESLNAYVVCDSDHRHGGTQFLVCDSCGGVQEAHICHVPEDLSKKTRAAGFEVQRWNAELHGLCRSCR
jgi:Fur family zinc uptake transcriptional regulator